MTRERAKELLPVIQAWAEGKVVQNRRRGAEQWLQGDPVWLDNYEYRIKPEPREWWLALALCRAYDTKESAEQSLEFRHIDGQPPIHVREVL